jgi:hypothetical protein
MASASSGGSSPTPAPVSTTIASNYNLFYSTATGKVYSSDQMQALFGINTATASVFYLNQNGFYPVNETTPSFDNYLYTATPSYTVDGEYAEETWTYVPRPLDLAKQNGDWQAKTAANDAVNTTACNCGFTTDLLTAVASQDPLDRPARYQAELDEMTAISNQLDADLTTIDNATTVDEINCVVNGASGIMVTGRGGAGPDDMQPSYFTDLQGLPPGVGEPELEIYIPGTDTVIPYDAGLPDPYKFDSAGNCYNTGDYRTTIRVAATGQVLSTVYPAEGPAVPVAWTYNPVIPSLGGGSSHSA